MAQRTIGKTSSTTMIHRVNISWLLAELDDAALKMLETTANGHGTQTRPKTYKSVGSDPIVYKIESMLRNSGVRTLREAGDHRKPHYTLSHIREWEQADLDAATHLYLYANLGSGSLYGTSDGVEGLTYYFSVEELIGRRGLHGSSETVNCPDAVKRMIESQGFLHMQFVPVEVKMLVSGRPTIYGISEQWRNRAG